MLLMLVLRPLAADAADAGPLPFGATGLAADAADAGPGAKGLAADAPDGGSFQGLGQKACRLGAKGLAADATDAGPAAGLGQKGSRLMLLMLVLFPVWGKRAPG